MKKVISMLLLWAIAMSMFAQSVEEDISRHRLEFMGGLTSCDTWQLDFSYHYMVCPYVGIGASLGGWKQYYANGSPSGYTHTDKYWIISDDDDEIFSVYLRPSILLISPTLFKIRDTEWSVMAEPGFMMNVPYSRVGIDIFNRDLPVAVGHPDRVSCHTGRWYAFDCRAGIYMKVEELGFGIGYMFSDLDVYGMRRNMVYEGHRFDEFYPRRKYVHGAFLSLSYSF